MFENGGRNLKSIALVVLYFGKIPDYAKLFFYSLQYNSSIDVLLFTDQELESGSNNLIIYHTTFDKIKKRIQDKFDFNIVLEKPYKLCDFRPAYGYIFEDELKKYDFWGHCDLDMVLGNIRSFLSEDVLNKYDKIYQHGHLCLYRNTEINNKLFMAKVGMDYKAVFTTPVNCVFDEVKGMQSKCDLLNVRTYKRRDCADISPWHDSFIRVESYLSNLEKEQFNYREQVFYWEEGHLYRAYVSGDNIFQDEFNYLHFQKRKMPLYFDAIKHIPEAFYITRDGALMKEKGALPDLELIKKYNGMRKWKEFKKNCGYQKYVWIRRLKKYLLKC